MIRYWGPLGKVILGPGRQGEIHGENDYSIEKESCEAGDETGKEIIRPEGHFRSCTKTNNGKKNIYW